MQRRTPTSVRKGTEPPRLPRAARSALGGPRSPHEGLRRRAPRGPPPRRRGQARGRGAAHTRPRGVVRPLPGAVAGRAPLLRVPAVRPCSALRGRRAVAAARAAPARRGGGRALRRRRRELQESLAVGFDSRWVGSQ